MKKKTWIRTDDLTGLSPVTQCYGICFDENDKILVAREPEKPWSLPGGRPENNETPVETLRRELREEVNIEVKNIRLLGVQRVEYPNNPNSSEGECYYQARFVCEFKKMLTTLPDPATGKVFEKKFVPSSQITEYVQWGELGASMFRDAIKLHKGTRQF